MRPKEETMSNRTTWQRLFTATIAALGFSALMLAPALAQAPEKSCTHEGRTYQSGERVTIGGKAMVCDGMTGTWTADKG
jgi:hypothetical protein